jgi:hypothetical protein
MDAMSGQESLGRKYVCFKCDCKFYDMNEPEPFCPRCGADQRENPNPDPREAFMARYRRPASPKRRRSPPKAKLEDPKAEGFEGDEGDDLLDDFDGDEGDDSAEG